MGKIDTNIISFFPQNHHSTNKNKKFVRSVFGVNVMHAFSCSPNSLATKHSNRKCTKAYHHKVEWRCLEMNEKILNQKRKKKRKILMANCIH